MILMWLSNEEQGLHQKIFNTTKFVLNKTTCMGRTNHFRFNTCLHNKKLSQILEYCITTINL